MTKTSELAMAIQWTIWLESPELQETIIKNREAIINKNIEPFKSEFVVIEQ